MSNHELSDDEDVYHFKVDETQHHINIRSDTFNLSLIFDQNTQKTALIRDAKILDIEALGPVDKQVYDQMIEYILFYVFEKDLEDTIH